MSSSSISILALVAGCAVAGQGSDGASSVAPDVSGRVAQYRVEPGHRGLAPDGTVVSEALELDWRTDAFGIGGYTASKSSPAVDRDTLYVGVDDGSLLALRLDDGAVRWRFRTHRHDAEAASPDAEHFGIHGSPAFDENYVYVGDYDGWLYAVRKDDGALGWERKLGGSIGASPVLHDGKLFVAVEFPDPDGKVFVLDARDGAERYVTPAFGHHAHGSVSIDAARGVFFVGANDGLFRCFDYVDRRLVWIVATGGPIKSTAAVAEDLVYVTSWDHALYAIGIDDGRVRFRFPTGARSMSSPSVHDGVVVFGSDDGRVYGVDAEQGTRRWSFDTAGAVRSSPTIVRDAGVVLVGSEDGVVSMRDLDDGAPRWSHALGAAVSSVPVAVGDALYVNDDRGVVHRFSEP